MHSTAREGRMLGADVCPEGTHMRRGHAECRSGRRVGASGLTVLCCRPLRRSCWSARTSGARRWEFRLAFTSGCATPPSTLNAFLRCTPPPPPGPLTTSRPHCSHTESLCTLPVLCNIFSFKPGGCIWGQMGAQPFLKLGIITRFVQCACCRTLPLALECPAIGFRHCTYGSIALTDRRVPRRTTRGGWT